MFTINQIKEAHSRAKTGADFPNYFKDLAKLGIETYETFLTDCHTIYHGKDGFEIQSEPRYAALNIPAELNKQQFLSDVKAHQQGKSDYLTICHQCANSGIQKWVVNMEKKTCTYYDMKGNEVWVEAIPA